MSALEEIQAAIDKLTALRDAAPGAPWRVGQSYMDNPTLQGCDDTGSRFHNEFASIDNIPAGNLIVTLRRTIDAQLAILRESVPYANSDCLFDEATELALARAINGGA